MWFERLMGFVEQSPEQVRANIALDGEELISKVTGLRVRCGRLTTPSLAELRAATRELAPTPRATMQEVVGDVGELHRRSGNAGALFQAASQFNLLEMSAPSVTPERGVGIYELDHTQGPACAVSCGAGTIQRNYFAPVGTQIGQTATAQLDCLAELGAAIHPDLWEMKNGYALAHEEGLARINRHLALATDAERDALRGLLRVGVQHDAGVLGTEHCVTQVYGSGMPVSYGRPPEALWEPIARLVLEASYEATLRVARARGIRTVFLTLLGGGVFGNDPRWIGDSILRALSLVGGLDVRVVSYGRSQLLVQHMVKAHAAG